MHGFALNVVNDLRPYDWIVPCGIEGCEITTMENELGTAIGVPWVSDRLSVTFEKTFGIQFEEKHPDTRLWAGTSMHGYSSTNMDA